jgi:hypothetical protein
MSVDLDRQLREYCRLLDEKQGALSFDDILEKTGELQVIPKPGIRQPTLRGGWIAAASAAFVVLITFIGIQFLPATDRSPGPLDQPTTTVAPPRSDFPESGPVEAGTYHIEPSESSVAGVTLTLPDGWEAHDGLPYVIKASGPDEEAFFYFVTVDAIYSDPCVGSAGEEGGDLMQVGPSVDDLAQALLNQPHTVATGPVDTTLGGLPAKRIDLTMADDFDTAECNVPVGLQIWYSEPADNYFVLLADGTASVYILDVNGERQVFLTQVRDATRAEDVVELKAIIESIVIDTATTTSLPGAMNDVRPGLGLPG